MLYSNIFTCIMISGHAYTVNYMTKEATMLACLRRCVPCSSKRALENWTQTLLITTKQGMNKTQRALLDAMEAHKFLKFSNIQWITRLHICLVSPTWNAELKLASSKWSLPSSFVYGTGLAVITWHPDDKLSHECLVYMLRIDSLLQMWLFFETGIRLTDLCSAELRPQLAEDVTRADECKLHSAMKAVFCFNL